MRFLVYRLPAVAYMGLIFFLSSRPLDMRITRLVHDWQAHASAYLVLYLLVFRAIHEGMRRQSGLGGYLVPFLITVFYGLTDEYHQSFVPSRDASAKDLLADAAGAALGWLLLRAWTGFRRPGQARPPRSG